MKRLLIIVIICSLLILGCTSHENSSGKIKVTLLISNLENPFFISLKEHAELACNEKEFELEVFDSKNDTHEEYINFIRAKSTDMILLNPVDDVISSKIVKEANENNIPVITIDRRVKEGDVLSHIASDNHYGGLLAGELIELVYREDAKLLLIEGDPKSETSQDRLKGVRDYLTERNIKVDKVITGNFNRLVANLNYKYLKDEYDIVFAANDEMALGVLDHVLESGNHAAIIGFDGTEEAISAVIDGFMAGTISQQPDLMARNAIELTEKYYKGIDVEKQVMVKLKSITMIVR